MIFKKSTHNTILLATLIFPILSTAQGFEWAQKAGGQGDDRLYSLHTDRAGNSYVTGSFSGMSRFGDSMVISSGYRDMFIAKYQANGMLGWIRRAGGKHGTSGEDLALDERNGCLYVTGFFDDTTSFGGLSLTGSPFYLAKYDTAGKVLWVRKIQTTGGGSAAKVAVDREANVYVCGQGFGAITFDTLIRPSNGFFLAKYDSSGKFIWVKFPTGSGYLDCQGMCIDSAGFIYVTGDLQSSTITFGTTTLVPIGSVDVFTVKYDISGEVIWAKQAGGDLDDYPGGITLDEDNDIYIVGVFGGSFIFGSDTLFNLGAHDIFLTKYDSSGNPLWARQIGGKGSDEGGGTIGAIAYSYGRREIVFIGNCSDSCRFDSISILPKGAFVTGYDLGGSLRWVKEMVELNPAGTTYATSVDVDSMGNSYLGGLFGGTTTFSGIVLTSSGGNDVFVTRASGTISEVDAGNGSAREDFRLFQNYPNPFNPTTQIQYSLRERVYVTLRIYNVLGQVAATLVDEIQTPGTKSASFNAGNFPSGLYFCRLLAGRFSDVKKMLLMK